MEPRKEEVLILSLAFSCPSPQALATWTTSPLLIPPMPDDGNRGHSGVVSAYSHPPAHPNSSLQFNRPLEPHYNLHLQKTESQSQRDLLGATELEREADFWPLAGVLQAIPHSLFSPEMCLLGQNLCLHPGSVLWRNRKPDLALSKGLLLCSLCSKSFVQAIGAAGGSGPS